MDREDIDKAREFFFNNNKKSSPLNRSEPHAECHTHTDPIFPLFLLLFHTEHTYPHFLLASNKPSKIKRFSPRIPSTTRACTSSLHHSSANLLRRSFKGVKITALHLLRIKISSDFGFVFPPKSEVPRNRARYKGSSLDGVGVNFKFVVLSSLLQEKSKWSLNLGLLQNWSLITRYHHIRTWSHYDVLEGPI